MLHLAQDTVNTLLQPGEVFPVLVVLSGLAAGLVVVALVIIAGVLKARAREETKREIAAYVAEGSIDRDTAIAMLRAGGDADTIDCAIKAVTTREPKAAAAATA